MEGLMLSQTTKPIMWAGIILTLMVVNTTVFTLISAWNFYHEYEDGEGIDFVDQYYMFTFRDPHKDNIKCTFLNDSKFVEWCRDYPVGILMRQDHGDEYPEYPEYEDYDPETTEEERSKGKQGLGKKFEEQKPEENEGDDDEEGVLSRARCAGKNDCDCEDKPKKSWASTKKPTKKCKVVRTTSVKPTKSTGRVKTTRKSHPSEADDDGDSENDQDEPESWWNETWMTTKAKSTIDPSLGDDGGDYEDGQKKPPSSVSPTKKVKGKSTAAIPQEDAYDDQIGDDAKSTNGFDERQFTGKPGKGEKSKSTTVFQKKGIGDNKDDGIVSVRYTARPGTSFKPTRKVQTIRTTESTSNVHTGDDDVVDQTDSKSTTTLPKKEKQDHEDDGISVRSTARPPKEDQSTALPKKDDEERSKSTSTGEESYTDDEDDGIVRVRYTGKPRKSGTTKSTTTLPKKGNNNDEDNGIVSVRYTARPRTTPKLTRRVKTIRTTESTTKVHSGDEDTKDQIDHKPTSEDEERHSSDTDDGIVHVRTTAKPRKRGKSKSTTGLPKKGNGANEDDGMVSVRYTARPRSTPKLTRRAKTIRTTGHTPEDDEDTEDHQEDPKGWWKWWWKNPKANRTMDTEDRQEKHKPSKARPTTKARGKGSTASPQENEAISSSGADDGEDDGRVRVRYTGKPRKSGKSKSTTGHPKKGSSVNEDNGIVSVRYTARPGTTSKPTRGVKTIRTMKSTPNIPSRDDDAAYQTDKSKRSSTTTIPKKEKQDDEDDGIIYVRYTKRPPKSDKDASTALPKKDKDRSKSGHGDEDEGQHDDGMFSHGMDSSSTKSANEKPDDEEKTGTVPDIYHMIFPQFPHRR